MYDLKFKLSPRVTWLRMLHQGKWSCILSFPHIGTGRTGKKVFFTGWGEVAWGVHLLTNSPLNIAPVYTVGQLTGGSVKYK